MILDKLMEKKDLKIYIDTRKKHLLKLVSKKELEKLPEKQRQAQVWRVNGRVLELTKLGQDMDRLKDASKRYWESVADE